MISNLLWIGRGKHILMGLAAILAHKTSTEDYIDNPLLLFSLELLSPGLHDQKFSLFLLPFGLQLSEGQPLESSMNSLSFPS